MIKLFSGWPSATVTEDTLASYIGATKDSTIDALRRSVEQFTTGRVERNNAFMPSAPEVAENVRAWQRALDSLKLESGPKLHNGLLEVDFGSGRIDMRGLTNDEQDLIMSLGGKAPNGQSLARLSLPEIRLLLKQGDLAAIEGGKTFAMPKLGRV